MTITVTENDGKVLVCAKGQLSANTVDVFDSNMEPLLEREGLSVELDFSKLEFISSSGLRSVLKLSKDLDGKGGRVKVVAASPAVSDVFKMTGFDKLLI